MTGNLSEHFSTHEFRCRCGCGLYIPNQELIDLLEKIRAHFGRTVTINCGTRCTHHNLEVGGAPDSKHLIGEAADIEVDGFAPMLVYNWVTSLLDHEQRGGVGNYKTFTHVDVRKQKARWRA